jgi:hypothetical protein
MAKERDSANPAGRSSLSANLAANSKVNTPAGGLTRRGFMEGLGVAGGVAVVGKKAQAAGKPKVLPVKKDAGPSPRARATKAKQLRPGAPSDATRAQIVRQVKVELDRSTKVTPEQARSVLAIVNRVLPQMGQLSAGHVVVGVGHHGTEVSVQTCSGGHLCDGDGPTDDNCPVEACDTQTCTGHDCETQSCGTEACSDHSCAGTFEGFVDVSGMRSSIRSGWAKVREEIDLLERTNQLKVTVTAP